MRADVAILGAGPAGAALGALLARDGRDVVLVDAREPVDCVGESLLPWGTRVIEQLGIDMDGFLVKKGAVFVRDGQPVRFDFADAVRPRWTHAWQVRRGDFDARVRAVAEQDGARLLRARVEDVTLPGVVHTSAGDLQAELIVDALGRRMFLANKLGIRDPHPELRNAAIARQFADVQPPPGWEVGDIVIYCFDGGWAWAIPYADGACSVGVVTQPRVRWRGDRWAAARAACPDLDRALHRAKPLTDSQGVSDFTAYARQFSGEGWALVGDASFFLDPVFSSGVLMSLEGASRLHAHLQAGTLADYEAEMRSAGKLWEQVVLAFYDGSFLDVAYSDPSLQQERYRKAIVSLLAGDVFDPLGNPLAHSVAGRFGTLARFMAHRAAPQPASASAR